MHYQINPWMILPFGGLLALIALAPLFFPSWWGKHYIKVSFGLAAVMVFYYFFGLAAPGRVLETGRSYFSFIVFIVSLFVVAGGIHINVKGESTPMANVIFLFVGAITANLLGTTGASMLLIRPWIRMNKYRITGFHIVFFIFIVSNVGGCLTPIGDPPLFLGYLMGIPFWWVTEHCWPIWLFGVGMLLAVFFVLDRMNFQRVKKEVRDVASHDNDQWRFEGLRNLFFLAIIIGAVFLESIPFLREALMIAAAAGSYFTTQKTVHTLNDFSLNPAKEVAVLFLAIFCTMMPALDWLESHAQSFGAPHAGVIFFSAGSLSSVLDNAPTYWSFLSAITAVYATPDIVSQVAQLVQNGGTDIAAITGAHAEQIKGAFAVLQHYHSAELLSKTVTPEQIQIACLLANPSSSLYIVAVTIGAVFFGANTYIGNGPNFMVKSIADSQKINTPGFIGYIVKYTLPVMLPMLVLVWLLFFWR
jgi:Na+/H+ antiporter NhaD/arsenite permease-like protein